MRPNQAGFRLGRGCADSDNYVKKSAGTSFKYQQSTVITLFIDFATAFDSIDRAVLWKVMEYDDMPETIIRLIKAFY
ncbi:unnamed protein product [Dracunculus medinensis]|uniref:Reverse transcriptase domain-containing protein n=1 Tax=Dracunculus medinensis TaxID=318479 RepID=A0A0N4UF65_DRAME|nr:unnamed protein product [Dracunculus medinensis]